MSSFINSPETETEAVTEESPDDAWLGGLSRIGWAWEFLRRNPEYRRQYAQQGDASCLERWGLRYFEDPFLDSRKANVFWRPEICSAVLPITATPLAQGARPFDIQRLQCSVCIATPNQEEVADVLFRQDGRILQLAVSGSRTLEGVALSASVVPMPSHSASRVIALRRFVSLVKSSALLPNLYPPERRATRLTKVLGALDFWREKRSYRDIGVRLFGEARVEREWNDPGDHLRDQVRRAVYYGRTLMTGSYRQFLR
jgi:hypothetical protein